MSTGLRTLQDALPRWVRLERRVDTPEVSISKGDGVTVVELNTLPQASPDAVRADVHFVLVGPTEGFPDREELVATVAGAFGASEFGEPLTGADLAAGPSYITLGGWLGSQDLGLMLIGAVELAGIAKAITPAALGITGPDADQMAGVGFVMLGPSTCWVETS